MGCDSTWKGPEEAFNAEANVQYLDNGLGYASEYICKNSTYGTLKISIFFQVEIYLSRKKGTQYTYWITVNHRHAEVSSRSVLVFSTYYDVL